MSTSKIKKINIKRSASKFLGNFSLIYVFIYHFIYIINLFKGTNHLFTSDSSTI